MHKGRVLDKNDFDYLYLIILISLCYITDNFIWNIGILMIILKHLTLFYGHYAMFRNVL